MELIQIENKGEDQLRGKTRHRRPDQTNKGEDQTLKDKQTPLGSRYVDRQGANANQ